MPFTAQQRAIFQRYSQPVPVPDAEDDGLLPEGTTLPIAGRRPLRGLQQRQQALPDSGLAGRSLGDAIPHDAPDAKPLPDAQPLPDSAPDPGAADVRFSAPVSPPTAPGHVLRNRRKNTITRNLERLNPGAREERNFFDNVAEKYQRGAVQAEISADMFWASMGVTDYSAVASRKKEFGAHAEADPIEADNWASGAFHGVAGMLHPLLEGTAEGAATGMAAFLGGMAIPAPEEIISVPLATMLGGGQYWYRQIAGELYGTMRESGVDHTIAAPLAHAMAIPSAYLEYSQMTRVVPGLKPLMMRALNESAKRTAAKMTLRYGVNVAEGTLEEVGQEVVAIGSEEAGKSIDQIIDGVDLGSPSANQMAARLWAVAKESFGPMAILMAPKGAYTAQQQVQANNALRQELEAAGATPEQAQTFLDQVEADQAEASPGIEQSQGPATVEGEEGEQQTVEAAPVEELAEPPVVEPVEQAEVLEVPPADPPQTPRQARADVRHIGQALELPPETKRQLIQRTLQDKFNRLGQLSESPDLVPGTPNIRRAAELYIGRASDQVDQFQQAIIENRRGDALLQRLLETGHTQEDLGLYLYARHAAERNAHVQSINPEFEEGGSGLTDAEAQAVLDQFEGTGIEAFAEEFYDTVTRPALQLRIEAGLIDQETFETLSSAYQSYVPLKGQAGEEAYGNKGQGFSVTGKDVRRARGRRSMADSPFVQGVIDHEEAIIRAEKNKVAQDFLDLVQANPSSMWDAQAQQWRPRFNTEGEIEYMDPILQAADDVLEVKVEGKTWYIQIHDKPLRDGLKNLGTEKGIRALRAVNNYLRAVNTTLNPEFIVTNFERDLQTAGIHLAGDHSAAMAARVIKDIPGAMGGIWGNVRGNQNKAWAQTYAQLKTDGGKVGWFDLKTLDEKSEDLQKKARNFKAGRSPLTALRKVRELIEDTNEMVESGVRLATYKNLIDQGVSREDAAVAAKNLTVNFNTKGNWGEAMNSLYLFSNAGIQGTARIFKAMGVPGAPKTRGEKRVQAIVTGIVGMSALQSMGNRMIDDDDWEDVSPWVKDNYWLQMLPNGKMIAVKAPYGYNVFLALGNLTEEVAAGKTTLAEAGGRLVQALDNSFNPLNSPTLSQFIAPTAFDPFIQYAENKNFFGGPIRPEQFPFAPQKPDSQLHFNSVRDESRLFAQWLNRKTGGSEKRSGAIDVSPELLDHFLDTLTGGLGKFVGNSITTGSSLLRSGTFPSIENIPVARQFLKAPSDWTPFRLAREILDESARTEYSLDQRQRFRAAVDRAQARGVIDSRRARKWKAQFNKNQRALE